MVPAQTLRENLEHWTPLLTPGATLVSLAKGMGVEAIRVATMEEFASALRAGVRQAGPFLIEVTL